ncbi:ABC transporter substrate-binding protein [Ramlibacter sp.]|uniref:ABC transporter substrate-binding protein n=1 Tax=Ramlibacter sp. TaxID=1917967 RepID=UPI003D098E96
MKWTSTVGRLMAGVLGAGIALTAAAQAQRGVTKDEILLGSILDLSGPITYAGKRTRDGLMMRIDEINASGGINGRKVRLIVEDHGYEPKRAVLAAQKLVNNDKVFAVLFHQGSAHNIATMPILFDNKVINFMPGAGARQMFEPPERLKIALTPSYFDQIAVGVRHLVAQKKDAKVCAIYQDDEFGMEHVRGAEEALKRLNMNMGERTSFKRGATDFSSQVSRLKGAGCTLVVVGNPVRETVGIMNEARKVGFNADFLGGEASYDVSMFQLGGRAVEGFYCMHLMEAPVADARSERMRKWFAAYKAKYGEDPGQNSIYAYYTMDIFAQAAKKAGPNLTTDSFLNAMDTTRFPNTFGGPDYSVDKTNRLGIREFMMSQVHNGKWSLLASGLKGDKK